MKWLILIIFISCGKHQSPPAVDLQDLDGDQVLNYQERSNLEKYTANFEPLGPLKGVIKFNHISSMEVAFSNKVDSKHESLKLLIGREDDTTHRQYYSEWSFVELEQKINLTDLKHAFYTVHLQFETNETRPEEVVLLNAGAKLSIGKWKPNMRVEISAKNLKELMSGKSHLAFLKPFKKTEFHEQSADESIKKKTYRIYHYDGKKSSIYYVSKALSFENFKRLYQVKNSILYEMDHFFFSDSLEAQPQWFERHFASGDKALVYASENLINEHLLKRFHYKKTVISRENGKPGKALHLHDSPEARIFIKLTSFKTQRSFHESQVKRKYRIGNLSREGYEFSCLHKLRHVSNEKLVPTSFQDFYDNIEVQNGDLIQVEEKMHQNHFLWKMKFQSKNGNTSFALRPRDLSTYVITGEYSPTCKDQGKIIQLNDSYEMNTEGKMSFEIESYVEKLD